MRDHITPAMHRQFMSMSERDIASASTRNIIPEHPNPQTPNPSNLLDYPPPPPSHTYSLPPSVTKKVYSTLSSPDPQTPPCLGLQRPSPPPPPLSCLLTLSRQQQWLYCTPEEADVWKPKRNEIENLDKEPKKDVRFASPHDEEDVVSKQKKCHQIKQQPSQLPSPHPNSPSPTKSIHHDIESRHSAPANKAFENMECKPAKKEIRRDEREEEDVGIILGNGNEEKGEALYECGGRANGAEEEERLIEG